MRAIAEFTMADGGAAIEAEADELWKLYITHPRYMDCGTRFAQHNRFHQQLTAFEKLVRLTQLRFPKDTLYEHLQVITKTVLKNGQKRPVNSKHKGHTDKSRENHVKISSVLKLRELISKLEFRKRNKVTSDEEIRAIEYFNSFFQNLESLKQLKIYFDERIYVCLYEYFFCPGSEVPKPEVARKKFTKKTFWKFDSDEDNNDDEDSGHYSNGDESRDSYDNLVLSTSGFPSHVTNVLGDLEEKLAFTGVVENLYNLNIRWNLLFKEGLFDMNSFEDESLDELQIYSEFEHFEPVFRLVPDLFIKCFKSVQLAKSWWMISSRLFQTQPSRQEIDPEFKKQIHQLEQNILSLGKKIQKENSLLDYHREDLASLISQERRIGDLNRRFQEMEVRKHSMARKLNSVLLQREGLLQKLEKAPRGTRTFANLERKMEEFDWKMWAYDDQLKLLEFQCDLFESDYCLELEMRPHMIRFVGSVEEKVISLEDSIKNYKKILKMSERHVYALKDSFEKMKYVLKKFGRSDCFDEDEDTVNLVNVKQDTDIASTGFERESTGTGSGSEPRLASKHGLLLSVPAPEETHDERLESDDTDDESHVLDNASHVSTDKNHVTKVPDLKLKPPATPLKERVRINNITARRIMMSKTKSEGNSTPLNHNKLLSRNSNSRTRKAKQNSHSPQNKESNDGSNGLVQPPTA